MAYEPPSHKVYNLRGRQVHAFDVEPQHLDHGTDTNQGTRDHVNGVAPVPAEVSYGWSVGRQHGGGEHANVAPEDGGRWDAGHILARQNGGLGNVNAGVFPQNPQINRGNHLGGERTRDQWRGPEQAFHNNVQDQDRSGTWSVTLRDQPRVRYDQFF